MIDFFSVLLVKGQFNKKCTGTQYFYSKLSRSAKRSSGPPQNLPNQRNRFYIRSPLFSKLLNGRI
jgi:hypothetical protein